MARDATDRARANALKPALLAALTERMTAGGWHVDPARDHEGDPYSVVAYRHGARGDFVAVIEYREAGPWSRGDPPLNLAAVVSVDYEPAYRLTPHLLNRPYFGECWVDGGGLFDPPQQFRGALARPDQAGAAADRLASIRDLAIEHARRHSTVDDLLTSATEDPELFHEEITTVPILLAAAGRHTAAREAAERYLATGREEVRDGEYLRFTQRLNAWIDEGGRIPPAPTSPVNPRTPVTELDKALVDRSGRPITALGLVLGAWRNRGSD